MTRNSGSAENSKMQHVMLKVKMIKFGLAILMVLEEMTSVSKIQKKNLKNKKIYMSTPTLRNLM